jgi:hypothetical protein
VIASRGAGLPVAVIAALVLLCPLRASAQWWSRAPADFEDCAEAAGKTESKEARTAALAECNARFAGRRKVGGGYTYYDFMQDRSFDIAGPNPSAEEQKHIDEQYTIYLESQRRSTIAAAFAARQQQQLQASPKSDAPKVPLPQQRPKQAAAPAPAADVRPRYRNGDCARQSFSCEWPRLSEGWNDLKRLLTSSPGKQKKS